MILHIFVIGDKDMKVFGKIKFAGKAAGLPESSCLKISLRDVTFKESKLCVSANKTYDMSNHNTTCQITIRHVKSQYSHRFSISTDNKIPDTGWIS